MTSTSQRTAASRAELGSVARWVALAVLVLAVLLITLDGTVLVVAIPHLSEDLKPSGAQLLWIGDIYSFVIAGFLVSMGSLGDRIGRKKLLLTGTVAFGAASALCAYATSPEMMILARAVLGLAGATLMPSTLALIRNVFPDPKQRSLAIGIWGSAASAGEAAGPLIGGVLLKHFWWGSVFLINVPVAALLVVVGIKLLPESRNPDPGPWDLVSVGLSLVGMLSVVYAVKEAAANGFGWDIVAAAIFGVAALFWFARRQLRSPSPLLDMRLFRHRGFSGAVLANLLTIFGLTGLVFFLSQFLQLVQQRSPLEAGLFSLPSALAAVGMGLVAGVIARRASVRAAVSGGLVAVGLALAACVVIHEGTGFVVLGGILFVAGLGSGLAFTVTDDVVLSSVSKDQAGAAGAVAETAFELGAALGIALIGSVVTVIYRSFTTPAHIPANLAVAAHDSLSGAIDAATRLPPHQAAQMLAAARDAFTTGLQTAAGVGAAVLLTAAVVEWFLLRGQKLEESEPEQP